MPDTLHVCVCVCVSVRVRMCRLRGLPAYVLDYSDLIPPNMVEKPFLKPVIVAGPTTGETESHKTHTRTHTAIGLYQSSLLPCKCLIPAHTHTHTHGKQRACEPDMCASRHA